MTFQKRIYIFGALVLLIAAVFSKGYYHFDEHFQILEFAVLKLHIAEEKDMPWEYFFKMRSAIQPAMVVCIYKATEVFTSPEPFFIAAFLRILSAFLSFLSMLFFIETFQAQIQSEKLRKVFQVLSFCLWFIIYNQVRFSSENWSGNVFLIALCLSFNAINKKPLHFLLIGFVLGIAFLFRYQTGFLVAGLIAWLLFIRKEKILHLVFLSSGVLLIVGAGVLIDKWFYGEWTLTAWNYFDQNILQNENDSFSKEPVWYFFLQTILSAIPPFSIVYLCAVLLFFRFYPKHIITFSVIPFILIHCIISHKEMRFLFPIVYYIPFMMVMVLDVLKNRQFSQTWIRALQSFTWIFGISNLILLLIVMIRPADSLIPLYEKLYNEYRSPTTLYYVDSNPYFRVLNIHFYKRADMEIIQVSSIRDIDLKQNRRVLFSTEHPEQLKEVENNWRLIYSALPEWIRSFNFNHWQERTRFWHVYELKR